MLFFDLLYIVIIILTLPFWAKYLFKKEYRTILKYRLSPDIKYSDKKRIWIHAVSVGEVRSLKNLIKKLKEKYKEKEIILSVTTPTGCEFAKKQYKTIKIINSPIDFSFTIKKFLKNINPELLILNELEIWPNWISITNKRKIPTLLINGRISDASFKQYKRFNFLLKKFLNKTDRFLVQAEIYKKRFQHLKIPVEKIAICGNIKADEAFNALEHLPPDREILNFLKIRKNANNEKKIVTIASSHLRDEKLVIPIINKLGQDFLFIIVPRHLERVEEIEKLLKNRQVGYSTWSKTSSTGTQDKVLIFDRMGYLFNILKITDIVFMGGTLEPKIGGHNLYEPAVMGKLIVGGPYYNNFPAIGAELIEKGVYNIIDNSKELSEFLLHIKKINFKNVERDAVYCVTRRKGSIQCTLKEIQKLIN